MHESQGVQQKGRQVEKPRESQGGEGELEKGDAFPEIKEGSTNYFSKGIVNGEPNPMAAKLYRTWIGMIARCHNPKHKAYDRYGSRGIHVCPEWRGSFLMFARDMGTPKAPHLSIDRKDNDLGYFKENCRWATSITQANNTSGCVIISMKGDRKTVAQWLRSEPAMVPAHCVRSRLSRGWDLLESLKEEGRHSGPRRMTVFGETKTISEWLKDNRCMVSCMTLYRRLKSGWEFQSALTCPTRQTKP